MLHRDPGIWQGDVEKFDPERFKPEIFSSLPNNAWKPFGNGQRACIGRPFAMQESILVLAMILQRFDLIEVDPAYQLKIKETLTLKPDKFLIRARKKTKVPKKQNKIEENIIDKTEQIITSHPDSQIALKPLLILFGSNSGSSESFSQRLASDAKSYGYTASIATLDEYKGKLPREGAVIIITASYEGLPTDNAKQFLSWLETSKPDSLSDIKYAVFGCGNKDWSQTYQAIPIKIDKLLAGAGACRIMDRGEADARGDFFGDFDKWYTKLWKTLAHTFGMQLADLPQANIYQIELVKETRTTILRQNDLGFGEVIENKILSSNSKKYKRHLEIVLNDNMTYRAGDYAVILPMNPESYVKRVLKHFDFDYNDQIIIHKLNDSHSSLPTGYPVAVNEIISNYVELTQPITKKQIETLIDYTQCLPEKQKLISYLNDEIYEKDILKKRVNILNILENNFSCAIPFANFLQMLPPMRTRQYSISSSPLSKKSHCTLTIAVVNGSR